MMNKLFCGQVSYWHIFQSIMSKAFFSPAKQESIDNLYLLTSRSLVGVEDVYVNTCTIWAFFWFTQSKNKPAQTKVWAACRK